VSNQSVRQWFAIAAIGRDRPGIVADLSECVYACGCNLEDASMTMLGNEFSTLMLVSGTAPDTAERLTDAAKRLEWERRLTIFVRRLEGEPGPAGGPTSRDSTLVAVGIDKAGIVAGVSRCLADHEILIIDLRGRVVMVPQSGTPLYELTLRMNLPASVDPDELEAALVEVGSRLDVEISLQPPVD
jgi:glycine cleavage system transcriptional repressor